MIEIDLSGKTAVVTGGIQGLGRATAEMLMKAGASVAANFYDDPEGIGRSRAAEAAAVWGETGFTAPADVRRRDQMQDFFKTVTQRFGGIDFLINNAAVLRDRSVKKMTDEEWETVIDTNLSAVFRTTQTALPFLRDGGRIVSMASISGVVGFFGQANYSSAKAGVIALTKVLSRELAARQINVNAVAPGVVLTEMGQSIPESAREQMLTQIPLRRFGEPEEIASVILWLCSDMATYVTGQTLHVNGGWWG
ncbi:MAG: 3-oxoacyl-ACP reductase FabG [Planctomycetaceae bacterium]|nr:3-oxoacyl-ACP reductase FabG [Planctomycetaceae bacterium]